MRSTCMQHADNVYAAGIAHILHGCITHSPYPRIKINKYKHTGISRGYWQIFLSQVLMFINLMVIVTQSRSLYFLVLLALDTVFPCCSMNRFRHKN